MIRVLVFLTVLAVGINAIKISPANCGTRPLFNPNEERIVNGTTAIAGDWSWSLSIRNVFGHFCGGVLIRKQWVLCAAHCFRSSGNQSVTISVVHNRNKPESWSVSSTLETVFIHENYSANLLTDDIALIRLKTPLEYDSKYVIPACVPENPDELVPGAASFDDVVVGLDAWITGFGHNRYGGSLFIEKQQVRLLAHPDADCQRQYPDLFVPRCEICAGNSSSLSGACQGDSGGPYVVKSLVDNKWHVAGLVSWGYSCGIGTVFAKVSEFIGWIKQKMSLYPDEDAITSL